MPHLIPGKNKIVILGHTLNVMYYPNRKPWDVEVGITRVFMEDCNIPRHHVGHIVSDVVGIDKNRPVMTDEEILSDIIVLRGSYIGDTKCLKGVDNEEHKITQNRDSWNSCLVSIYSSG